MALASKISRSPRAEEILAFIVTHRPRTLYEISHDADIPYNSLHMNVKNLVRKNLIELDLEESRGRGRNATIYSPTFKGLLVFLSKYHLPKPPRGWRVRRPNEDHDEAVKRLAEEIGREKNLYERAVGELKGILEEKGAVVHFPLFQYCRSISSHPRLYEIFIKISHAVLESPFKMTHQEESLLAKKVELEKNLLKVDKLQRIGEFKLFMNDKEIPHDPTEFYRQQIEYVSLILDQVHVKEDEILRESFFLRFLRRFHEHTQRFPNRELYDHVLRLLEKKRREFDSVKGQLKTGLDLFRTS